jgi:hypothetical protein
MTMAEMIPMFRLDEDGQVIQTTPVCGRDGAEVLCALQVVAVAARLGKTMPFSHPETGRPVDLLVTDELLARWAAAFGPGASAEAYQALRKDDAEQAAALRDVIHATSWSWNMAAEFERHLSGEEHALLSCYLRSGVGAYLYDWVFTADAPQGPRFRARDADLAGKTDLRQAAVPRAALLVALGRVFGGSARPEDLLPPSPEGTFRLLGAEPGLLRSCPVRLARGGRLERLPEARVIELPFRGDTP